MTGFYGVLEAKQPCVMLLVCVSVCVSLYLCVCSHAWVGISGTSVSHQRLFPFLADQIPESLDEEVANVFLTSVGLERNCWCALLSPPPPPSPHVTLRISFMIEIATEMLKMSFMGNLFYLSYIKLFMKCFTYQRLGLGNFLTLNRILIF